MAESEFYEKLSIRDSVKSLKKYGSTSRHTKRDENFVKHTVTSTDTLQGLALKYGVTMEQIRRTNRLWASDSLFLREFLLIPVPNDSPYPIEQNIHTNNNRSTPTTPIETEEPSIDTFLSNIDSSIANTKKDVRRAQGNSEFVNLDSNGSCPPKRHYTSRMRQSTSGSSSEGLQSNHTVPMVITQTGRKVKSSLQRLEQQQDEMFEL